MIQNVLFITTHNLATNPRLVKEIKLANELGYDVKLICFEFDNWSKAANQQLLKELDLKNPICIPAGRNPFFPWFRSAVLESLLRKLNFILPASTKLLSFAVSRRSVLLLQAIKQIDKADLVIGHNPGAMYASLKAAERFNCKSGFDVEDYHPGETHDEQLKTITLQLMKNILPRFDYLSFASVSIFEKCKNEITLSSVPSAFVVNNSFSTSEFLIPVVATDDRLRLVWFSQNIDKGRGLEQLIPLVSKNSDKLSLTLFGNCNADFKNQYIDGKPGINLGGTLSQKMLHHQLANFDVGLAIEPGKDLNNELALSNKFFAYLQSGLFILATETKEQKRFLNHAPDIGLSTKKDFEQIEEDMLRLHLSLKEIRSRRLSSFEKARSFSWENISIVLKDTWNHLTTN